MCAYFSSPKSRVSNLLTQRSSCPMRSETTKHFLILILAVLVSCSGSESKRTLRLAHGLDPQSPVHQAMAHFGAHLEKISAGRIEVLLYPGGQLGNERESLELVQLGALDIVKVSSAVVENFVPEMAVFSLPYLFRDADHYWQIFGGEIGKELLLKGEPYLLRGLCFYDAGFRSFFLIDRAVESPADLEGLKIRVMRSNTQIRTINLLGGNATPLPWGELYSALQQGVVDGAENAPLNFFQNRFYELCEYLTLDEHSAPPDVLVIGTHTWNSLSGQEQQWVDEAVAESIIVQKRLWEQLTEKSLAKVQEAGVTVLRPDKQPFFERVQPIYDDLGNSELGQLARRIRGVIPENESVMETRGDE